MKDLPLIEVVEIEEKLPSQWEQQLAKQVNNKGVENSFDKRVKINGPIDVWDIKQFYGVNVGATYYDKEQCHEPFLIQDCMASQKNKLLATPPYSPKGTKT